jgi:manganese/zinc/iron transport system permease protein
MSTNTAGMMAVVAGLFLFVALLASPRHGILARLWRRRRLELDILREDVLGLVYRLEEHGAGQVTVAPAVMRSALGVGPLLYAALRAGLRRRGHLARLDGEDRITEAGRAAAGQLVRSHRLWESYLHKHLALRDAHAHATAGKLEHVTDLPLRRRLAERTDEPVRDPQGRPIPPPE